MAIPESEARRLVIEAGHRLQAEGLIARTWGNISARISDTQFVITPSGLAYDTLREDQLVVVNIADCSYTGDIKPSSEKGIHADSYRCRPEVDFIIHTHQFYASCVGLTGKALALAPHPLLGSYVPCAAYGMPSTKKLRQAVEAAVAEYAESKAVFLLRHGALCMGSSAEEAFAVAQALETVCKAVYDAAVAPQKVQPADALGDSRREEDRFLLTIDGEEKSYPVELAEEAPAAAKLHAAIYRATEARCIMHAAEENTLLVSACGKTLRPRIDDLAQIAGVTVRCAKCEPSAVVKALRKRDAVLVQGQGALCIGVDRDDAEAVAMILEKCCAAERYASVVPNCRPLSRLDAYIQRQFYLMKYSKRKAEG